MRRNLSSASMCLLLTAVLFSFGCGEDSPTTPSDQPPEVPESAVPEFSLLDVNPNSATTGTNVSPRDYVRRLSAWYFGHAT